MDFTDFMMGALNARARAEGQQEIDMADSLIGAGRYEEAADHYLAATQHFQYAREWGLYHECRLAAELAHRAATDPSCRPSGRLMRDPGEGRARKVESDEGSAEVVDEDLARNRRNIQALEKEMERNRRRPPGEIFAEMLSIATAERRRAVWLWLTGGVMHKDEPPEGTRDLVKSPLLARCEQGNISKGEDPAQPSAWTRLVWSNIEAARAAQGSNPGSGERLRELRFLAYAAEETNPLDFLREASLFFVCWPAVWFIISFIAWAVVAFVLGLLGVSERILGGLGDLVIFGGIALLMLGGMMQIYQAVQRRRRVNTLFTEGVQAAYPMAPWATMNLGAALASANNPAGASAVELRHGQQVLLRGGATCGEAEPRLVNHCGYAWLVRGTDWRMLASGECATLGQGDWRVYIENSKDAALARANDDQAMATLTPAELEIVNGFAEHIMEGNRLNTGDPREKIRSLILERKYGTAAVDDAFPVIDWDRFFDENVCPLCGNQIEFRNDVYACRGCGLTIPLRLYERARERNRQEKEHQRKGYELSLKVKDAGLREDRMDELYRLGVKRAQEKLQVAEVCADEPA